MALRHVILDRDGVLNREAPDGGWIVCAEDWIWEQGALEGLRRFASAGLRISVVTNQSGIGRGVMTECAVEAVNERMCREAAAAGIVIDAVFVCPHAPDDGCRCRKPAPGLIEQAVRAARIPESATVVIGDASRDIEAARTAGVQSVLVRTGKGRASEVELRDPTLRAYDDLAAAAAALIEEVSP